MLLKKESIWRPLLGFPEASSAWILCFALLYTLGTLTLLNVLSGQIIAMAMIRAEQNAGYQVQKEQREMQVTMMKLEDILTL